MDDPIWDHSTFTKNRDRLLEADIARRFFREVVDQTRGAKLLSDKHFSVDGTLIQAWASMKRFRPKDGSGSGPGPGRNSERDFHGEKRSNDTHASETDTDARLYRKSRGQGAQLCYQSHLLMENRNGLIVDLELTPASGTGERTAAVDMVTRLPGNHRVTVGADRGYDSALQTQQQIAGGVLFERPIRLAPIPLLTQAARDGAAATRPVARNGRPHDLEIFDPQIAAPVAQKKTVPIHRNHNLPACPL